MTAADAGRPRRTDAFLYLAAAISYISLAIFNRWLLDWVVGPLWLVLWVWGVPAIGRKFHGQPVFPNRPRSGGS